jgi:EAL domain-containing protein (putative c-di-GMP-specific phosphodiesterase class I)
LIRKADLALYKAKSDGRDGYRLYDDEIYAEIRAKRLVENDLRMALVREEFLIHYQPVVSNLTNEVIGAEALVRWQHPRRGLLSPAEFIPAAEASGLIAELGTWVLRKACNENRIWQQAGMRRCRIAVNISPLQFQGDALIPSVEAALVESGLDPQWLELEITEGMVMDNIDQVTAKLKRLREIGVQLAIDDFGTGYSSLAYLSRFPVQRLKVDRSFVKNVATDQGDAAISQAIINLGHILDLRVTAEGVENDKQIEFFRRTHCDEIQGFYFSRPLATEKFVAWYNESEQRTALAG